MKLYQLFTASLIFVVGLSCVEAATPAAPDPAELAADWWTYIEPKESLEHDAFNEREAVLATLLEELIKKSGNNLKAEHIALAKQFKNDLKVFNKLKYAPLPAEKPDVSPAQTYTINEALQSYTVSQNLKQEINAEIEELDWQKLVIAEDRKQQSRRRSQYLEREKTDPGRSGKGLELMASRIKIELKRLELERRSNILQRTQTRWKQLQSELDLIPDRLIAPPAETQEWKKEYAQAQQQFDQLRNEAEQEKIANTQLINTFKDASKTKFVVLASIKRDIDLGIYELASMRAQLALALTQLINKPSDINTEEIRKLLTNNQLLAERLMQQRTRLHRLIEKIRDSTSVQFSENATARDDIQNLRDKILSETSIADQSLRKLDQDIAASTFLSGLLKHRQAASEGWLVRTFSSTGYSVSEIWSKVTDLLGSTLFEISETPVTTLGIIRVFLILTAALWISKGLRRGIKKVGGRRGAVSQSSLYTLGRIIHYIVLAIGIMIGLSSIGIDFTKFALFASALGIGIGFGLQTLISNFVAGLIILFEKSLKVKDFVELESGVTGEVKEINMRSTLITTNDNIDVVVPNSEFVSSRVTNWTLREVYRRAHISFGVAYGTDKDLVKTAALEAASEVPWTLMDKKARQPQVWLVEFGDSSLNFELVVWLTPDAVKRPSAVQAAYLWEIETKLKKYGIEIPFPQRDLHVRSVFGLKDDAARSILPGKKEL